MILVKFAITMKNLTTLSYRDQSYRSKLFIRLQQVLNLFQIFCFWFLNILSLNVYSQQVIFIAVFLQTPNLRPNSLTMSGFDEPSHHNAQKAENREELMRREIARRKVVMAEYEKKGKATSSKELEKAIDINSDSENGQENDDLEEIKNTDFKTPSFECKCDEPPNGPPSRAFINCSSSPNLTTGLANATFQLSGSIEIFVDYIAALAWLSAALRRSSFEGISVSTVSIVKEESLTDVAFKLTQKALRADSKDQ